MIFTYPHIYYKQKYEEILNENPKITKCIYFMFTFGSAIEYIYDFIHKYNKIGVIIGNRSFFHVKLLDGITNITKLCNTDCHCFNNDIDCLKIISYLNNSNFLIKVTNNPFDIFINYSNMVLHPSLWINKYNKSKTFENDVYVYRDVTFDTLNIHFNITSELNCIKKKLSGDNNYYNINYINIPSNILFDFITTKYFESTMPKNYFGNKEVKIKHYLRDVINGLYYMYKVSKIYNCQFNYIKKIINTFKENSYFKDIKIDLSCNKDSVNYFYDYYQNILNNSSYVKIQKYIITNNLKCDIPIFFIRHAEGQHQITDKFKTFINKMTDPLLTIKSVNNVLYNKYIDENTLLISSTLLRCVMTAKLLCSNKNIKLHLNDYFRERSLFILPEDKLHNENKIPLYLRKDIDIKVIFDIIQYYKSNKNYNKCVIVTHRNFISKITKINEEDIKNLCFIEYKLNTSN
jgi:hypothetical protein